MDGRTAAMNVFGGAMMGASVPFVTAIALAQATTEFRLLEHLFTLILLAIACGAVGVVINLPSSEAATDPVAASKGFTTHRQQAAATASFQQEPRSRHGNHQQGSASTTKRYAMSRLAALKVLDLPHDAGDEAVREAYRRLAKENHPDQAAANGPEAVAEATKKFVHIREAYEVLIDEA